MCAAGLIQMCPLCTHDAPSMHPQRAQATHYQPIICPLCVLYAPTEHPQAINDAHSMQPLCSLYSSCIMSPPSTLQLEVPLFAYLQPNSRHVWHLVYSSHTHTHTHTSATNRAQKRLVWMY